MRNKQQAIERLIHWFEQTGWPLDVNEQKLRMRASVGRDSNYPGCDIVQIERHRPILGTHYTKGHAMDAFSTYYMRYAVHDDDGGIIKELKEEIVESEIDAWGLVEMNTSREYVGLEIRRLGSGSYRVSDTVSNDSLDVGNLEEAISFGNEIADSIIDHLGYINSLEEPDSSVRTAYRLKEDEIAALIKAKLEEKIRGLWRVRDANNDDDDN